MTPYEQILQEENEALRAALRHLVLYCEQNKIEDLSVTLAKNCLNYKGEVTA